MIAWLTRSWGGTGIALGFVSCFVLGVFTTGLMPSSERVRLQKEPLGVSNAGKLAQDGRRLEEANAVTVHIIIAKNRLLDKLVHGEWSLREAAHFFQLLDEGKEGFSAETFRTAFPGASLEESYARAVIARLRESGILSRPAEGNKVLRRLKLELERNWPPP